MADGLRDVQLQPQAAPTGGTYVQPERPVNDNARFKAEALQNAFAKAGDALGKYEQVLVKQQVADKIIAQKQQQAQYRTEAAFRADNMFAQLKADTWGLTQTTDPEKIKEQIDGVFNERFGGLFGEDADPYLAEAMVARYQDYIPKAIETAGIKRNERRQVTFLGDISQNVRNTLTEARENATPQNEVYDLLDSIFNAANTNENGVTGAMINASILGVGTEADEFRNIMLGYAKERKLDQTNNPEYEKILNSMIAKGATDEFGEWRFNTKGTLQALAEEGRVQEIMKYKDEVLGMGTKFDQSVDWFWGYVNSAETAKGKIRTDAFDKQQLVGSVEQSIQEKRVVTLNEADGDPVAERKVRTALDDLTDPTQENTIEAYGDVLTWHKNSKIESIFDASVAALQRLDDDRPFGVDEKGQPIWEVEGNPVSRAEFNTYHVGRFSQLAERVKRASGIAGLRNQLGQEAFRKYEVISTLRKLGRSDEDIGRYLASPSLPNPVTKKEVSTVLTEVNKDQDDWDWIFSSPDSALNVNDAYRTVQDYTNYVVSLNGGDRSEATMAAISDTLKEHYDVIKFGSGHTLIETTNPELVRAFSRNGTPITKDDLRVELGVALQAYQKELQYRYDAPADELIAAGKKRINIDPENLIIRQHPNREDVFLIGDNMGNIVGETTATKLAAISREEQARAANSSTEDTYMDETKRYVDRLLVYPNTGDDIVRFKERNLDARKREVQRRMQKIREYRAGITEQDKDPMAGFDSFVEENIPSGNVLDLQEQELEAVMEYLDSVQIDDTIQNTDMFGEDYQTPAEMFKHITD